MNTNNPQEKLFSVVDRAKSISHAWRGLGLFIKTTHNAWIQILILLCVISAGLYFHITSIDWIVIIFAAGFVFVAEAFNTALEIDINLTSPEFHPYARDTKDVAAGAVFLACITAVLVGVFVFVPYLIISFT